MKGRANYLCLHRLAEYRSRQEVKGRRLAPDDAIFLPIIEQWVPETETGDRAELAELPEDLALWHEVSATAETCLGSDCPRYSECFVTRMRQRAAESDVVIVNHHLLCADAAVRESAYGEVIPVVPAPGGRRGAPARGRRHAVLRRRREQPPGRRPGARRRGVPARLRSRPAPHRTPPAA